MVVIQVSEGQLRGKKETLLSGATYYSFKGIPYAQPPVGELRFKAPLPPVPWDGVRDAIVHGSKPPQKDVMTGNIHGEEDCLYLNVYSRSMNPHSKTPVMLWIHGGAFKYGSGDSSIYGPGFLLEKNVVLVTINYRVEVLGFLCMDTLDVPGNAGMKDQVAAMKWVKENIEVFGGDPRDITIFGESAGGVSVAMHLVSPISRGLFNKAIVQSTAWNWAWLTDGRTKAFQLGKFLGKETDDANELLTFLQSLSMADLVGISHTFIKTDSFDDIPFLPVVEKDNLGTPAFLSKQPIDYLTSGEAADVPVVLGVCSGEGILFLKGDVNNLNVYNERPELFVPTEVKSKNTAKEIDSLGKRIRDSYFKGSNVNESTIRELVDFKSDAVFIYPTFRLANLLASVNSSPVYFYYFDYIGQRAFLDFFKGKYAQQLPLTVHGGELAYIFENITFPPPESNTPTSDFIDKVTTLWTNFAKKGAPTPDNTLGVKWERFSPEFRNFLTIGVPMSTGRGFLANRLNVWEDIYKKPL